eukprot:scaffold327_cov257-Pinguiococcus_pyrenoidosus.AAC.23
MQSLADGNSPETPEDERKHREAVFGTAEGFPLGAQPYHPRVVELSQRLHKVSKLPVRHGRCTSEARGTVGVRFSRALLGCARFETELCTEFPSVTPCCYAL